MRQCLHIFRKDVRHLWPQIAAVLLLTAAMIAMNANLSALYTREQMARQRVADVMRLVLPLAWWYLIAAAVHEDRLPGDRQFWITRPYRRLSLFGAKALLIVAFINLPLFLADGAVLAENGFSPWPWVPGLLWKQLVTTVVLILPGFALAAVTRNLSEVALAALLLVLGLMMSTFGGHASGPDWGRTSWVRALVFSAVLCAGVAAVLWRQFRTRSLLAGRLLLAGTAAAALGLATEVSFGFCFDAQSWFRPAPPAVAAAQFGFDARRAQPRTEPPLPPEGGNLRIDIPVAFQGLPPDLEIWIDAARVDLEGSGRTWHSGWIAIGPRDWVTFHIARAEAAALVGAPVRLRSEVALTVFGSRQSTRIPLTQQFQPVAGAGICNTSELLTSSFLLCRYPLRQPGRIMVSPGIGRYFPVNYTPFPADFGIAPVAVVASPLNVRPGAAAPSTVLVELDRPIAHLRRSFEIELPRLGDYVVGQSGR